MIALLLITLRNCIIPYNNFILSHAGDKIKRHLKKAEVKHYAA